MNSKIISVNLLDNQKIVIIGLKFLLSANDWINLIDIAHDTEQFLEQLEKRQPNIIIMDFCPSDGDIDSINGLEAAKIVLSKYPDIKILMLTMHSSIHDIITCLECGIQGYMLKSEKNFDIIFAINELFEKGHYLSPEITPILVADLKDFRKTKISLSKREMEILYTIFQGNSAKEAGDILCLSPRTVESHRKKLMDKFNARNTVHLIYLALQMGILKVNSHS